MKELKDVKKVVISLSGGLDSTTLLYLAVSTLGKENVYALSYSYGQRHNVELELAKRSCKKLGVAHRIIDIGFLGDITKDVSAMVEGSVKTPNAHTDLEAGKQVSTYVPFRNMILSSITLAFAESVGADSIALGVQYGDYENSEEYFYWDCSKAFTEAIQAIANLNNKHKIAFVAPFVEMTKAQEIALGTSLNIPYGDTITCYNPAKDITKQVVEKEPMGGTNYKMLQHYQPCGTCPSCVGRADAFAKLGIVDPCVRDGIWG